MLSLAETEEDVVQLRDGLLETEKTSWGYIVREKADRFDHETVLEASCRFLGFVLVLCAYAQWFLPGLMFNGDAVAMKGALSFFLCGTGVAVYWFASRGLRGELEVDQTRRELRLVSLNSRGHKRLRARICMRDIESAFLRRTKEADAPAFLMVRLRRGGAPIKLATGLEDELMELQQRLKTDVKPVSEKLEERMARSVTFLSSRIAS